MADIIGTSGDDTLAGTGGPDTIQGLEGNDALDGLGGNDLLDGGAGIDQMTGGAGDDAFAVDDAADSIIEADGEGNDRVYASTSYVLAAGVSVELLSAVDHSSIVQQNLTGNELDNIIWGSAGGNGLTGGDGNDSLEGFGGHDFLSGGDGNDYLNGGTGNDDLSGGEGDDIYLVDQANDTVTEAAGNGHDIVYASTDYTLGAGMEVEVLAGLAGAIALTGNELAQELWGNGEANTLDGRGGADIMLGGDGNDLYYVDNAGDTVFESAGASAGLFDIVQASVSWTLTEGAYVEVLQTTDSTSTAAINLTGNALDNTIRGNAGANVLQGAGGVDTLSGRGGDDIYYVDQAGDQVIESQTGGFDIVYATASYALNNTVAPVGDSGFYVEILAASDHQGTAAIDLTGNRVGNELWGNDGANTLDGGDGIDSLWSYGGVDTLRFTTALGAGNVDHLFDFAAGTDRIALDDAVFTTLTPDTLAPGAFASGTAAGDSGDRIIYDQATGRLWYDSDGTGAAAQILFAVLENHAALTAGDFIVI